MKRRLALSKHLLHSISIKTNTIQKNKCIMSQMSFFCQFLKTQICKSECIFLTVERIEMIKTKSKDEKGLMFLACVLKLELNGCTEQITGCKSHIVPSSWSLFRKSCWPWGLKFKAPETCSEKWNGTKIVLYDLGYFRRRCFWAFYFPEKQSQCWVLIPNIRYWQNATFTFR